MKISRVSLRYGKALMKVCDGNLDLANKYLDNLKEIKSLFGQKYINKILVSPVTASDLKWRVLEHVLDGLNSDIHLKNFIKNIVYSGRTAILVELPYVVDSILAEKQGVVQAHVISSLPLEEESKKELSNTLNSITGKKIQLTDSVDKKILGGVVVKIGNKLIDLSIKSKLETIVNNALL